MIYVNGLYWREIVNMIFIGQVFGHVKNFNSGI